MNASGPTRSERRAGEIDEEHLAWHGSLDGAGAPASAADLAARPYTKAPPPIVSVYDWGGFYIGANGGWGSSHKCWDFALPGVPVLAEGCHDATGGVAGGQIGYRWQSGTWVFGLEAQGDWADLKGRNDSIAIPGHLHQRVEGRCLRPVHRPGRLCRQQRAVLRQGWRGRDRGSLPRGHDAAAERCRRHYR